MNIQEKHHQKFRYEKTGVIGPGNTSITVFLNRMGHQSYGSWIQMDTPGFSPSDLFHNGPTIRFEYNK